MTLRRALPRKVAAGALLGLMAATTLTACTGGGEDDASTNELADADDDGEASPEEVLAYARELIDGTSGVDLSLSTTDEPAEGDYLREATGTITTAPAFEGAVTGRVSGLPAEDVDVISVDGDLWVNVPILGWDVYDPSQFCAPDPATLLDPDSGVSAILTDAEGLEAGDAERGGEDNDEILTPYSGTVPAASIQAILPCAEDADYDAKFLVDGEGYLRSAELTGPFFPDTDEITYTLDITAYDVERDISAPE